MLILRILPRPFPSKKCQIQLWRTSLSSRDTHVVLAAGGLMGTHVILRSRFFLPFTARQDAHVSKWILAFFLQAPSSQQPLGKECRAWTLTLVSKMHSDTCPKFQARARAQGGFNDTVDHCSVEIAKGALTDHFPGPAAKHCTPKVLLTLHGH